MKRQLLAALVAARQKNEPVVLVRGLNTDTQFMVTQKKPTVTSTQQIRHSVTPPNQPWTKTVHARSRQKKTPI